jgi:Fe-S-cluster containining protein
MFTMAAGAGKPGLTDLLCTKCGLCCNGSLFADVELAGAAEASALEAMGLEIEDADGDGGELLVQPCRALQGKRCGIYPHRPECCRTFECRLLQEAGRGKVSVAEAQVRIMEAWQRIRRVKGMAAQLEAGNEGLPLMERCGEALATTGESADLKVQRKRTELQREMGLLKRFLAGTFLQKD